MKQYLSEISIVACVVLLLACGWLYHGCEKARNETKAAKLEFAQYVVEQANKTLQIKLAHLEQIQEIEKNAEQEQLERDRRYAEYEHRYQRLRAEADTSVRNAYNSALAKGCTAEGDFILVQRELYTELTEFARGTAREVEERKAAGLACEKSYGTVFSLLSK